jgi:deoxyribose-phosphate aldolase
MRKVFDFKSFLNKLNESTTNDNLVGNIDYTLLNPSATEEQILELCEKADKLGVKSVCVLPKMVKVAANALKDSNVLVCTVVSFPHGTDTPSQKLAETKRVIADGADEVDMVLNYKKLQNIIDSATDEMIEEFETEYYAGLDEIGLEISYLVEECHQNTNKDGEPIVLKVIVESGLLDESATEYATLLCIQADADFIKTSTGMVSVGAELEKVIIMRNVIDEEDSNMKIKASGGIRTMADLQKFATYVDRFGVGFAAVDSIFGNKISNDDSY